MPTEGFRGKKVHWWALMSVYLSMLFMVGIMMLYVNHVRDAIRVEERKSDKRWCNLLTTYDEAYKANPPTTPIGIRLATEVRNLRNDYGC